MRAVIICNGSIGDYDFVKSLVNEDDVIVCADGALRHCIAMNIKPHVWIGDKDSCCDMETSAFEHAIQNTACIALNPVKDATDTEECCKYVIENGFDSVLILGALGSRFDHTIANVYLLKQFADKNIDAKIADEHNMIYFAKHHNIVEKSIYNNVSVIPVEGDLPCISNKGFYYPLNGERLEMYTSRGVSNYLTQPVGEITLDGGSALIILSRD